MSMGTGMFNSLRLVFQVIGLCLVFQVTFLRSSVLVLPRYHDIPRCLCVAASGSVTQTYPRSMSTRSSSWMVAHSLASSGFLRQDCARVRVSYCVCSHDCWVWRVIVCTTWPGFCFVATHPEVLSLCSNVALRPRTSSLQRIGDLYAVYVNSAVLLDASPTFWHAVWFNSRIVPVAETRSYSLSNVCLMWLDFGFSDGTMFVVIYLEVRCLCSNEVLMHAPLRFYASGKGFPEFIC